MRAGPCVSAVSEKAAAAQEKSDALAEKSGALQEKPAAMQENAGLDDANALCVEKFGSLHQQFLDVEQLSASDQSLQPGTAKEKAASLRLFPSREQELLATPP